MPVPARTSTPTPQTDLQLDDETLGLLSTIHAHRDKLDPESQQLFDQIVDRVGAKNVPGTVAYIAKNRVPDRRGDFVEPTIGEHLASGVAGGVGMIGTAIGQTLGQPIDMVANNVHALLHPIRHLQGEKFEPIADLATRAGNDATKTIEDTLGVRPNAVVDTSRAVGQTGGLAAVAAAPVGVRKAPVANVAVEDLPEVQNLTRTLGGGVDLERGVHAGRGTARAGIVFDPKNPAKFVADHEAAINHAKLARDQMLATEAGTSPSIATSVALQELDRAAAATRLSPSEAEGLARLRQTIASKGDLVSAADLHNAVQAGGANVPGSVRRAFTPLIDANVNGYSSINQHMADLIEGKGVAARTSERLMTGTAKRPNRIVAGARTVSRAAHGDIIGAASAASDLAGGAEVPIDVKGLARSSRAAADAAKAHAQSNGLFSANPSLNILNSVTETPLDRPRTGPLVTPPPESEPKQLGAMPPAEAVENYQPRLTAAPGPSPRLLTTSTEPQEQGQVVHLTAGVPRLLPPATTPEGPFGTFVAPQRSPGRALPPVSGPSVQPSISSPSDPFLAPRQVTPPYFYNELHGVKVPSRASGGTVLQPEPNPSLFKVPARPPRPADAVIDVTATPVVDSIGNQLSPAELEVLRRRQAEGLEITNPAGIGRDQLSVPQNTAPTPDKVSLLSGDAGGPTRGSGRAARGRGRGAQVPTRQPGASAGRSPEPPTAAGGPRSSRSAAPAAPTPSPSVEQTPTPTIEFSKGDPVRYSVSGSTLRGRVLSDVKMSKHGPYVEVSSEPDRGQYSILVRNLSRISSR